MQKLVGVRDDDPRLQNFMAFQQEWQIYGTRVLFARDLDYLELLTPVSLLRPQISDLHVSNAPQSESGRDGLRRVAIDVNAQNEVVA